MKLFKGLVNDVLSKIDSKELDPHNELIGIRVGYGKPNRLSHIRQSSTKKTKKKCC